MSSKTIKRVRQMHEAFGFPVNTKPTLCRPALRSTLLDEECREVQSAIVAAMLAKNAVEENRRLIQEASQDTPLNAKRVEDLMEDGLEIALEYQEAVAAVLHELVDLQYVLNGTLLEFGMADHFPHAFAEVHRANMSKLGADGKPLLRADGKGLKGPNFKPANVRKVLPKSF